jgi:hypothetical protein
MALNMAGMLVGSTLMLLEWNARNQVSIAKLDQSGSNQS